MGFIDFVRQAPQKFKQMSQLTTNAFGKSRAAYQQSSPRTRLMLGAGAGLFGAHALLLGRPYGQHHYQHQGQAFPEGMPLEQRQQLLADNPAPGTTARSTPEGGNAHLHPFGPIHTKVNEDRSVTNTTQPGHMLHNYLGGPPGQVHRRVEGSNIVSTGTGSGFYPRLQEYFGPGVWGQMALQMRLQHDPAFRAQHEAVQARREEAMQFALQSNA